MSKARCNALELKKEPRFMPDMPSDKPKSALHLTRLNDYHLLRSVLIAREGR